MTPLHLAIHTGNLELLAEHLAAGWDVDALDKIGRTPLHVAAAGGQHEAVR